ncbi:HAD-IC family P-type ATPase, partial [Schumannella luteola]
VASGSGSLLVVRTGSSTELAAIAARLSDARSSTGFEKGMARFGLLLSQAMLVLVVVIFVVNLVLRRPPIDAALFSLALAVGLTPQLLPAIVAIGLSQGARAMARRRVIVRRLDAIEDIGSMSVLCSDKTGTMTEGRITLARALGLDGEDSP